MNILTYVFHFMLYFIFSPYLSENHRNQVHFVKHRDSYILRVGVVGLKGPMRKNIYFHFCPFLRSSAIPVTAEIVPMPVVTSGHSHVHHHRVLPPQHHSHQQIDQHEQPIEVANDPAGIPPNMSSSISSGAITSSSFMPTSMSSSIAATLPRNLENGYAGTSG